MPPENGGGDAVAQKDPPLSVCEAEEQADNMKLAEEQALGLSETMVVALIAAAEAPVVKRNRRPSSLLQTRGGAGIRLTRKMKRIWSYLLFYLPYYQNREREKEE